ncbi:NAD-dependent epimerase/dehydratase family protein [Microbacterium ulmi]|uniref:NAD-dependent epimerase/dehydratase family protein n=1 Tax=Microbacterium ulmi TaxID=179095 RepID=A0A7Y2LZJ6_9MICO|nr:NAD-dependent epimerase/dehydratase family protein [Microbacterium ulmi]NII70359.1 UDP-glucose 4-epimerase [Microbacterium ulmi]NNH03407.1 NAD-dependent epimerase/dehydratase family protein [Microbacterium ulmi]
MTTPATRWVIGRGLLGAEIVNVRRDVPFHAPIDWSSPDATVRDLRAGLKRFGDLVGDGAWEIYWSAGRGVTSTPMSVMELEADVYEAFLDEARVAMAANSSQGRMFLSSSVGGAYAGSSHPPFTESTPPRPLSAYGEVKLRMEGSLREAVASAGWRGLIARVTNIYGPGQNLGKGQGLISVIIESYVTGKPTSIFVSLDTLRDYIYATDCARVIDAAITRVAGEAPGTTVLKIVGAMNALSIGAIVGEISRLRRKPVPIVLGQGSAAGQAIDLRVRSEVWPDLDGLVATTLPEGLGAIYRAVLASHMLPR